MTSLPEADSPLPTLAELPTLAPSATPTMTDIPTDTPTITPSATITQTPRFSPTPTQTRQPSVILLPSFTPSPTFGFTPTPLPDAFVFGFSVEGRELLAFRIGTGEKHIMLVGGIHAGFEANTSELVTQLRDQLIGNPTLLHPDVTFVVIPTLNPDGMVRGRISEGRFNGNGVDLNRNWGCGWEPTAYWSEGTVNPGTEPFDQPETRALGGLIQQINPKAVLFYHSAANGVFAGECEHSGISDAIASSYGTASGYPFGTEFTEYPVTGTAPSWVASQGIPSLDIELSTADDTEFSRNLQGIIAVQSWVLSQP